MATVEQLKALHIMHHQPVGKSLQHGTQTFDDLFRREKLVIYALKGRLTHPIQYFSRAALRRGAPCHPLARRADRILRFLVCAVEKQGFLEKSLALSRLAKQCLMSNRTCCGQRRRKRGLD